MRVRVVATLLCILMVFSCNILGMTIGSDTAPERFNTQQLLLNGDRVAGFASLDAGFALNGLPVTATWDSFFPISGAFDLNFGTLVLNRDLILHNVSSVGTFGDLIGNGHALEFPCLDRLPTLSSDELACVSFLINQTAADNNIFTVDWSFDDNYLAVGLAAGGGPGGENLYVYSWDGATLTQQEAVVVGGTSPDINDIKWNPSKYILALVRDTSAADEVWTYSFDPNAAAGSRLIAIDSAALPANGMGVGWTDAGDFIAVGSEDTSGQLRIYSVDDIGNITLEITEGLGTGQIASEETTDFNVGDGFVALGVTTNGVDPELLIYSFDKTTPSVTLNSGTFFDSTVEAFAWSRTSTDVLAVGFDGGAKGDIVEAYEHDPTVPSGGDPGSISLIAATDPLDDKPEAISFSPIEEGCLVVGADGPPGSGQVITYFFDRDAGTVDQINEFIFQDDCETARWSRTGRYLASGSDFQDELLIFETAALPSSLGGGATRCARWSNIKVFQTCNLVLSDVCITFTGECVWDGRGHCLELATTTTLQVEENSSLMFRDISLKGMDGTRIGLIDSSTTLSFNNAQIILSNNYSFTLGRLDIIDDVEVLGEDKSFIFTSTTPAHVTSDSRFIFDKGTTFRYAPQESSRTNLILDDATAQLVLDSATLSTSSVGLQLTSGKIMFDGLCMIVNEGTSDATSVELGDGTLANNVTVRWLPACNVEVNQGRFRMNNV